MYTTICNKMSSNLIALHLPVLAQFADPNAASPSKSLATHENPVAQFHRIDAHTALLRTGRHKNTITCK